MTALRVRILLLAFATGAVLGQSFTAHAASLEYFPNLCSDLRNGMPLVDVETLLLARGYSASDAGVFTGRMVLEHCPDQRGSVVAQAREALR
jgi:hypothetical protein